MTRETLEKADTTGTPRVNRERRAMRRGVFAGLVAGIIGLGCCVYPVVLALVGLATAAAAVDLGNFLYAEWGWAFRLAALAFAGVALTVQWRRRQQCPANQRPTFWKGAVLLAGVGVATYAALYAITTALGWLST